MINMKSATDIMHEIISERDAFREALESIVEVHNMYCEHHVGVSKHSYDLSNIASEALDLKSTIHKEIEESKQDIHLYGYVARSAKDGKEIIVNLDDSRVNKKTFLIPVYTVEPHKSS